jgi:uncharacterized protein YwgA
MTDRENVVAAVVEAAGGRLTGRVRLQKMVYLLDLHGLNSGFPFEYHHYGPYSRDVDIATADAKAFLPFEETFDHRSSDGARYSIFTFKGQAPVEAFGPLGKEKALELGERLRGVNVTVLELAATVDWLWRVEKVSDWRREVARRKNVKVQNGRLEKAIELLRDLGHPPPEVAQAA